jgi:hypothetical protein
MRQNYMFTNQSEQHNGVSGSSNGNAQNVYILRKADLQKTAGLRMTPASTVTMQPAMPALLEPSWPDSPTTA